MNILYPFIYEPKEIITFVKNATYSINVAKPSGDGYFTIDSYGYTYEKKVEAIFTYLSKAVASLDVEDITTGYPIEGRILREKWIPFLRKYKERIDNA